MEIEMESESDSTPHSSHVTNTSGINCFVSESSQLSSHSMPYSTQSLSRRLAPNSIGLQTTPTKTLLNQTRRSSSGIFITSMFASRFRHLQKLHSDAFLGLNSICFPGLPMGAVFRSSLPATPVATPIHREAFQQFSEQAIRDRLCRTPSPRKNLGFLSIGLRQTNDQRMRSEDSGSDSGAADPGLYDVQPMDVTTPVIDEPVIEDTKGEENTNGSGFGELYFGRNDRLERNPSDLNERRIFVGNISYRVTETELSKFFQKFGKVFNCVIVKDHINKLPKGYGFITFANVSDSRSVLNVGPNDLILDNRQLRVFAAKPKTCKQMKNEIQELSRERELLIGYRDCEQNNEILNFVRLEISDTVISFNDLDDDVLIHIFGYLDSLVDRTVVESVCKRWREVMQQFWSTQTHLSFTNTFFRFESPALETATLFSIVKKCPNLKSIDLKHVTNFLDSKAIEIIAVSCPQLQKLVFDSGVTTDYALRILGEKCLNLKSLFLNDCTNFSEKGFWWLLKSTKQLETLQIRNNCRVNGNCFRLLSQTLQSLDITNCQKIKEKGFKELVGADRSALKCLAISAINYNIMEMICSNLHNLEVLRISHFSALNQSNETISGFSLINKLENLEILENSANFEDINNDSILSILLNCKKLNELILVLSLRVDDISIGLIPQYLPNLKRLSISESKISDESLLKLSAMTELNFLDISGSYYVTDIGVQSLALSCKSLTFLELNRCDKVSVDCIKFIVKTFSSDSLYPELIISYNRFRIKAKNSSEEDIEKLLTEREEYFDSDDCDLEEYDHNDN